MSSGGYGRGLIFKFSRRKREDAHVAKEAGRSPVLPSFN